MFRGRDGCKGGCDCQVERLEARAQFIAVSNDGAAAADPGKTMMRSGEECLELCDRVTRKPLVDFGTFHRAIMPNSMTQQA